VGQVLFDWSKSPPSPPFYDLFPSLFFFFFAGIETFLTFSFKPVLRFVEPTFSLQTPTVYILPFVPPFFLSRALFLVLLEAFVFPSRFRFWFMF